MRRPILFALAALPLLLPAAARADDIADALAEATRAYRAGEIGAARMSMQEAVQLLAQRTAADMGKALPAPLDGWKAQEAEASTAGLGFMGGGSQATRIYRNGAGQDVQIQVTADSPLLAQMTMFLNNPAIAGAMGKLIRVGSQRAIQTNNNEIQMMVNNRILVSITGSAPAEAKLAYAQAIDIAKLSSWQ